MYNYKIEENGVFIKNLANTADQYGITQYRLPLNYELLGKEFTISDGESKHHLHFIRKDYMELDGKGCFYESLKIETTSFFVRLGYNIAVVDLAQNLITLIIGDEYFYGAIDNMDQAGAAHVDAPDDMVGTSISWVLGAGRYVVHEFLERAMCRVSWSPLDAAKNDHPCKVTKIRGPLYLVDVKGFVPYHTCAPIMTNRYIALQDYERMFTVGCVMGRGSEPFLISGYARFLDEGKIIRMIGGRTINTETGEIT